MYEALIKAFRMNRIKVELFKTKSELLRYLDQNIIEGTTVGVGDSMTLEVLEVYHLLREKDVNFLDKYNQQLIKSEKKQLYMDNFFADTFISGVNAITENGKIINLDGNGSRVAPIIYGPKKVFLIAGTNKIVKNEQEAIQRIKKVAAPLDAVRLGKNTPCTKLGYCIECKSADKICNYLTTIQGQFDEKRIELLIIEGAYGY
jgi:hypothetical protein